MARSKTIIIVLCLGLAGCQSSGGPSTSGGGSPTTAPPTKPTQSYSGSPAKPAEGTVAFINSQPLGWANLHQAMVEAASGRVLLDEVLDRGVTRRLTEQKLTVTPDAITHEQELLAQTLDGNPDQAQRLLNELRERQGYGETRFKQLLTLNAGLRLLIQKDVVVNPADVQLAFDNQYGPRYEVRLILVGNAAEAAAVIHRTKDEDFTKLAIELSKDSSRAQGGLLSPISPADPTYPNAIRMVLPKLEVGQVSDPVALDRGIAIVRLERKIDALRVKFEDVKETLEYGVRIKAEHVLMQRLARTIVTESDVVILDPALQKGWNTQKARLLNEPQP